jgi:transcriptional regulator with XRE-family HTH domain
VTVSVSELGDLLRHWRRVRRMSQLDLANEARTTARYVSFVETGRASPSREMVGRLAMALDVPLRERNGLLVAAGYAPRYANRPLDDDGLRQVNAALELMLAQHEPFPAVVMDPGWTVLRSNGGARRLFGGLLAPRPIPSPANVLELMLEPGPVRDAVLNWEPVAATLLARVRREAIGGVVGPAVAARLPDLAEVRAEPVLEVRYRFAGRALAFFSLLTTVGAPVDVTSQELRIEAFFPADDETRAFWTTSAGAPAHRPGTPP